MFSWCWGHTGMGMGMVREVLVGTREAQDFPWGGIPARTLTRSQARRWGYFQAELAKSQPRKHSSRRKAMRGV